MPSVKMKTHKGTKRRFKVTATGKVVHKRCGSSHLNSHKSGKRIRKLRKPAVLQNKVVAQKTPPRPAASRGRPRPVRHRPGRRRRGPRRPGAGRRHRDHPGRVTRTGRPPARPPGVEPEHVSPSDRRESQRCERGKVLPAGGPRSACSRPPRVSSAAVAGCSGRPRRPCSAPACSPSGTAGPRSATSAASGSSASAPRSRCAACSYSRFIQGLKLSGIALDRKSLSELAIHDPETFDVITARVRAKLEEIGAIPAAASA